MRRKLTAAAVAGAAAVAMAFVPAGASAGHCVEGDSPGFSYFGTVHVKGDAHSNEGGNPGPHNGTPGASNCRDTSGSPSERAPGQKNR